MSERANEESAVVYNPDWMHDDSTECTSMLTQALPSPMPQGEGGRWWCLEHDKFLYYRGRS